MEFLKKEYIMNQIYEPSFEQIDYSDYIDPTEDWVHIDELTKYDYAEEHLKEVINQVYNIGNIYALEDALDNLAGIFEISLPNKNPKLIKRIKKGEKQ